MKNRTIDFKDSFTLSLETGIGAKARVGPLGGGCYWGSASKGLRGGEWCQNLKESSEFGTELEMTVTSREEFLMVPLGTKDPRMKSYSSIGLMGFSGAMCYRPKLDLSNYTPARIYWPYFTQVEGVVSVGYGLRVGFNPGEFIDFILGWFGVDIYGDDILGKPDE